MTGAVQEVSMPHVQTEADIERGRRLREARTEKGLSQRAVAAEVGIPQAYVSFYELADPRYPLTRERFNTLMEAIRRLPPPEAERGGAEVLAAPARVRLPEPLAKDWRGLDIEKRSEIVEAGYRALGRAR